MRSDSVGLARQFVERKLAPWTEFEAALVLGSIGHGEARPNSDVDMMLVFDPLDIRIVPGEFVWVPADDSVHTIRVDAADVGGVQIDAKRVDLAFLDTGDLAEGMKHELAHSLTLFDRSGRVARILERRLAYPEETRRVVALQHRERAAIHVDKASEPRRQRWLSELGWAGAIDLVSGAMEEVVSLLHALNGEFEPYRYRRLLSVAKLDWVPADFPRLRDAVLTPPTSDAEANFHHAHAALEAVLEQVDAQLRAAGWAENIGHAWAQSHAELGFAYNMPQWRLAHEALLHERSAPGRPDRGPDTPGPARSRSGGAG